MKEGGEADRSELVSLRVKLRLHDAVVERYEAKLEDLRARNTGLAAELNVCSALCHTHTHTPPHKQSTNKQTHTHTHKQTNKQTNVNVFASDTEKCEFAAELWGAGNGRLGTAGGRGGEHG